MNTGFKKIFRGLFEVSTNEVRGYYILFMIVLFSLAVPVVVKMSIDTNSFQDERDLAKLDSLVEILDRNEPMIPAAYLINPNSASYDSLIGVGMRKDIARRLINYRKSGGQFKYREGIMRIYGLDKKMFKDLAPHLALPDSQTYFAEVRSKPMDINKSKVLEVIRLAGLDGGLAGRVMNYRDLLGGYVSRDQFDEVYGLTDDQLKQLKNHFFISKHYKPMKIKVNRGSWQDLSRHPYISKELAKSIVRYREINGPLKGMNELSAFSLVDEQKRNQLFPYLEF